MEDSGEGLNDQPEFVGSGYRGGQFETKLSFRAIVLQHLNKILNLSCVEFRGGYWQEKLTGGGRFTEKYYVPDTREVYDNAVNGLAFVLHPHFDEEMKKAWAKHKKVQAQAHKEYIDNRGEEGNLKEQDNAYLSQRNRFKQDLFISINDFLSRIRYLEGKVFEE